MSLLYRVLVKKGHILYTVLYDKSSVYAEHLAGGIAGIGKIQHRLRVDAPEGIRHFIGGSTPRMEFLSEL